MFTLEWVKKTAERAIKTMAQAAAGIIGVDAANWMVVTGDRAINIIIGAGILSLLTSIITTKMGSDPHDPSAI